MEGGGGRRDLPDGRDEKETGVELRCMRERRRGNKKMNRYEKGGV